MFHRRKFFGDDNEIMYDSVINHDVYNFLRISLDVPRNQTTKAIVIFNGQPIGEVYVIKNKHKKTAGYKGFRYSQTSEDIKWIEHRKLGRMVAAIVSDYVV